MTSTTYFPGGGACWRCAPTAQRPNGTLYQGTVHDPIARALGGVAGNAGLFSTARDVAAWGEAILREREGARVLGDPAVLETLLMPDDHAEGPPRALGFDLPSGPRSSAGTRLGRKGPRGAAGHLAFTGCSVWIDFDRALTVALLTNRVHPTRENQLIREVRPTVADAVVRALAEPGGVSSDHPSAAASDGLARGPRRP